MSAHCDINWDAITCFAINTANIIIHLQIFHLQRALFTLII